MDEHIPLPTKLVAGLSVFGLLHTGYLSAAKTITGRCVLNEPCQYILGFSTYWYFIALYAGISAFFVALAKRYISVSQMLIVTALLSVCGIFLSAYFTIIELTAIILSAGKIHFVPIVAFTLFIYMILCVTAVLGFVHRER